MKKLILHGAILLAAFSSAAADRLRIASFSSVLTEIAGKVGGAHVAVAGLIPAGSDPHEYEPTPADLRAVSAARLILTSGRQLENYRDKLQEAGGGQAELLAVGDHLPDLTSDPHWWNSVPQVEAATRLIRDELSRLAPAEARAFAQNAQVYLGRLAELQHRTKRKVAELPRDQRKLVTAHDAFQAFAREFGFTVFAIEGANTEGEPSNRHVAQLIDEMKKQRIKAIFVESTLNPKVTEEITRETGAKIGGVLFADGLAPGKTYAETMEQNVSTIVEALR